MEKYTYEQLQAYLKKWFCEPQYPAEIPAGCTVDTEIDRAQGWLGDQYGWQVKWFPNQQPIGTIDGIDAGMLPDYVGLTAYHRKLGLWIDLFDKETADQWYVYPMEETYHYGRLATTVGLIPWCLGHCDQTLEALQSLLAKLNVPYDPV